MCSFQFAAHYRDLLSATDIKYEIAFSSVFHFVAGDRFAFVGGTEQAAAAAPVPEMSLTSCGITEN